MQTYQLVIGYSFLGVAALLGLVAWYKKSPMGWGAAAAAFAIIGLLLVTLLGQVDPSDDGVATATKLPLCQGVPMKRNDGGFLSNKYVTTKCDQGDDKGGRDVTDGAWCQQHAENSGNPDTVCYGVEKTTDGQVFHQCKYIGNKDGHKGTVSKMTNGPECTPHEKNNCYHGDNCMSPESGWVGGVWQNYEQGTLRGDLDRCKPLYLPSKDEEVDQHQCHLHTNYNTCSANTNCLWRLPCYFTLGRDSGMRDCEWVNWLRDLDVTPGVETGKDPTITENFNVQDCPAANPECNWVTNYNGNNWRASEIVCDRAYGKETGMFHSMCTQRHNVDDATACPSEGNILCSQSTDTT